MSDRRICDNYDFSYLVLPWTLCSCDPNTLPCFCNTPFLTRSSGINFTKIGKQEDHWTDANDLHNHFCFRNNTHHLSHNKRSSLHRYWHEIRLLQLWISSYCYISRVYIHFCNPSTMCFSFKLYFGQKVYREESM